MDRLLDEEFLKEFGIISVKTIGEPNIPGISLIVEFKNGDVERRHTNLDIVENVTMLMDIVNIRSRKKKLENIMKSI